jgi:hypothetical protein
MFPITYQVSVATLIHEAAAKALVIVGLDEVAPVEDTVTPPAPAIVIVPVAPVLIMFTTAPTGNASDEFKGIVTETFEVEEYLINLFLKSVKTKVSVVPATSLKVRAARLASTASPKVSIAVAPSFTKSLEVGTDQPKLGVVVAIVLFYPFLMPRQAILNRSANFAIELKDCNLPIEDLGLSKLS